MKKLAVYDKKNWPFCIYIYIYIYTNPFARAGYDTRSIFKQSLTGLNSEFFLLLD